MSLKTGSQRTARIATPRIRPILVLVIGFVASGCFWDGVQVFAWARMFAENLDQQPVAEALSATFSGEAPCKLCKAVQASRKSPDEENPAVIPALKRPLLLVPAFKPDLAGIPDANRIARVRESNPSIPVVSIRPPVPPPRVG